jgi:HK97 family phage major capsid protein
MAFGLHDLKLGSDKVLVAATDELLSNVSWVESYLLGSMVGKLYWKRDYNILVGTYSAAVQGCIGITNAGAANFLVTPIAHNATYTSNIVNKIMSGVDVTLQDGAEWFMSNSTKSTLVGLLGSGTTTSTQPIFSDNNTELVGKPINVMSQMATFGSVDDILYGNFAEYTVGQKGDVVLSMSKDYSFNTDETYFKAVIRYQGAPTFRTYTPVDGVAVAAFSTTSK